MSDRLQFTLDFDLRRDTPPAFVRAVAAQAMGLMPEAADLAALPYAIASYLQSGSGQRDLRFCWMLAETGYMPRATSAADPAYRFVLRWEFHDDEYYNFGMFLIYWLFQFAAQDGQLGSHRLEFDQPPTIYTRYKGEILQTDLSYSSEEFSALDYRQTPLDADAPIVVRRSSRVVLTEMLDGLTFMNQPQP